MVSLELKSVILASLGLEEWESATGRRLPKSRVDSLTT